MKLTSRGEYGLLALVYLARHYQEGYITGQQIASEQNISLKFLEQIMLPLKRAKYVQAHKGQHGGYRLAKPPEQINLAEIIRLLDGPLAPTGSVSLNFYTATPVEKEPNLINLFREIRDYLSNKLENTTLADVA